MASKGGRYSQQSCLFVLHRAINACTGFRSRSAIITMNESKTYLGEFEELVLWTILAMEEMQQNADGVTIRQLLEKETGRSVSYGALYTTLDRLERKRYVTSWQGG